MLFHPAYRIFAAVLPLVFIRSASSSDTSNDDSGSSLWDVVPECAKACVENFVKSEYTSEGCSTTSDVECLCRTKTPSGLTIGEAGLSCVYALCSETIVQSSSADVYRICDSVSGAVAETHKTITASTFPSVLSTITTEATTTDSATAASQTSDTAPTATTQSTTSTTSTASPGITVYHPASSETGAAPVGVSTETPSPTSTSSSSPSSSPSATGNKNDHHVSAGTVIGVSVVSGVAGSFIIGVAVFFLCKRWRRNNRVEDPDSDFEIGGAMAEPPGFSRSSSRSSTPGPRPGPSSFGAVANRQEMSQSSHTLQPGSQRPPRLVTPDIEDDRPEPCVRERIGLAASSDSEWGSSPRTLSSQATLSELLPNQGAGLYPKPLRWTHRPISEETLFEEDEFQQGVIERRQNATQRSGSPNVMTGLPANPRALKDGFPAQKFLRAPGQQRLNQSRNLTPDPTTDGSTPPFARPALPGSETSNSTCTQIDSSGSPHETSSNKPLTTPFGTAQGRILSGTHSRAGPTTPTPSSTLGPPAEIVSRPRIVRGDDIKRVQIRSSPRPPSEVGAPWGPDDLWLERGRGRDLRASSSEVPYPSEVNPGTIGYPSSPKKRPEGAPRRVSPTSRNVTPSRRGQDLFLRVD